jgi:predicted transcriptional regulator
MKIKSPSTGGFAQNAKIRPMAKRVMTKKLAQLNNSSDYEDTPDEKIVADIQEGLRQVLDGEGIPAEEAMALIRKQIAEEKSKNRVRTKHQ